MAVDTGSVEANEYRGVWAGGPSTVTLRNTFIEQNGGTADTLNPYYGGVTTSYVSATIDMGSISVAGNNVLCGNGSPSGYLQIDSSHGGTITNYGNTVTNGPCPQ